jgi:hypothetical protein
MLSEDEIRLVWKALDGESPLIARCSGFGS